MASQLLSLHYELRVYIYELVLCTQGTVQLVPKVPVKAREWASSGGIDSVDELSFDQSLAPEYPPGACSSSELPCC